MSNDQVNYNKQLPNAEDEEELTSECKELLSSLPNEKGWGTKPLYLYQNFWCRAKEIQSIVSIQNHFKAENTDIMLATIPKSGTTWLKAMSFAVINRQTFDPKKSNHPLLDSNPHELVPFLEYKLFANYPLIPDLSLLPKPRIMATHVPLGALPSSVMDTECKIVYMARNPFDTFVSIWYYYNKVRTRDSLGPVPFEKAFDMYCDGFVGYGPYWDHMLGYWKESLRNPSKVLFLKYEDVKGDVGFYLKKLAEFLGSPFTVQEEEDGVVEEIAKICSFEHLKELEVNKKGKGAILDFENTHLFRKAQVGDWVNHLTPAMKEKLNKIMEEKLAGTGLSFKLV